MIAADVRMYNACVGPSTAAACKGGEKKHTTWMHEMQVQVVPGPSTPCPRIAGHTDWCNPQTIVGASAPDVPLQDNIAINQAAERAGIVLVANVTR